MGCVKVVCPKCHSMITKCNLSAHRKTARYMNFIDNPEPDEQPTAVDGKSLVRCSDCCKSKDADAYAF